MAQGGGYDTETETTFFLVDIDWEFGIVSGFCFRFRDTVPRKNRFASPFS